MIQHSNLYLIAIISLIMAIFFGGLGTSFLTGDTKKPETGGKSGGLTTLILSLLTSNPAVFIITMLLGYFISLVCLSFSFAGIIQPLVAGNFLISSGVLNIVLQIIATSIILVLTVVSARLSIFRINPYAALKFFALPALFFYIVFYLISLVLLSVVKIIARFIFGIKGNIGKDGYFNQFAFPEFHSPLFFSNSDQENENDEEPEIKIFQNVLEFSKLKVRDCMIPRNEIEALEVNSKISELRKKFISSGYSKILVYQGTIDNIIGYVNTKDLFNKPGTIRSMIISLSVVTESNQINKLLRNLIKERRSIALVVDEYGGTSGIITLEDILEEIFGEIEDEHDTQEFVEREINENEFILSGRLEIDYLNEKYKLNIPETEDYDTLAGYIIFTLENIPDQDAEVRINNLQIQILKVSQTRIELVHVTRILSGE